MDELIHNLCIGRELQLPASSVDVSNEAELRTLNGKALKSLSQYSDKTSLGTQLANCVILFAVNVKTERWNNRNQVTEAGELFKKLICGKKDIENAALDVLKQNTSVCKKINQIITKTLKQDSWQKHAIVCQLYFWYCQHLKFPLVSDHLDVLLPPCLIFMDSYDDGMKLFGLKCLNHLLKESGQAELLWHNRAQVIYDALHKLTYTKSEKLIVLLHPTMIKCLEVFDRDLSKDQVPKFADTEYHELISGMYLEDKLVMRRAYANSMKMYVQFLREKVIKHLKLTMEITLNYLEDSCGSAELTRLTMLEVLSILLDVAQPRVKNYFDDIVKHLLRLVIDTCMLKMEPESKKLIIESVTNLLKRIDDQEAIVKQVLEQLVDQLPSDESTGKVTVSTLQRIRSHLNSKI